jgi:hypothetical protein
MLLRILRSVYSAAANLGFAGRVILTKVAYARAIKHGARPVRFNARTVKFRLSEIIRIEEEATATPASILEGVGA